MEQSEGFRKAVATIQALEKQLADCSDAAQTCENSKVKAEREIEEHFARLMNALAARKEALLKEVDNTTNHQSMRLSIFLCVLSIYDCF
jgi:hypothetical protein